METDEKYMRRALQLAALGAGSVSPNPMVGAVIVAGGRIIGEGYHRQFGEAHAEVNAVRSVAEADEPLLKESTIYVTLEPCSHYGKTPPCSKLLIEKGIPRIVVGCLDPFEKVSGRGVRMLRDAGREVIVGVLEEECRKSNAHFMTAHSLHRPYVLLKWAETADGFIAGKDGSPVRISTPATSVLVHKLRSEYDAILVGAHTAVADNPSLTTRLWSGRSPLRIVYGRETSLPSNSKLLTDGLPTLVFTNARAAGNEGAVEYLSQHDFPTPDSLMAELYRRGITSLMVEGGHMMLEWFYNAGAYDALRIERNPRLQLNEGVPAPDIRAGIIQSPIFKGIREYSIDGNIIAIVK